MKMKVSELRIGNLVKHASSGKTCIIEGIYESGIMTSFLSEKGSVTGGIQFFEPIPITAKGLERLGFTHNIDGGFFFVANSIGGYLGEFAISIYDSAQIRVWRNGNNIGIVSCAYINQLQNLYYALTGEELTLKTESK